MSDQEPTLSAVIAETNAPVKAGDELTVTVTVSNRGEEGEGTVTLIGADGEELDSTDVELEAGAEETAELTWTPEGSDVGEAELTVEADEESVSETVTVEDAPAEFEVDIERAPEHVPEGGSMTVSAVITNTGTLEGTTTLEITVNDDVVQTQEVSLAGGEEEHVEYTHEAGDSGPSDVTIGFETADDSASETVAIVTESVSIVRPGESKGGMSIFAWLMFLGMAIILIPLLPIIALIKLIDMLFGKRGNPA